MPTPTDTPALVFFDVDGTLLNDQKVIPASAFSAIKQLQNNGHQAFLNTGRPFASIQPHILDVGFDGIIAACGTWIEYRGEQLLNRTLEPDLVSRLIQLFEAHSVDVWFEGPTHVYIEKMTPGSHMSKFLTYFADLPGVLTDWQHEPVVANKMSYMLHPESDLDACLPILELHFDLIRHLPVHGEIVPKGFTKATGMQFLLNHLNIPRSQTYAFGDSLNDIDMLSFAQYGIAMAGSRNRVLRVSDHVTASPDEHGIAEALKHYGLI